VRLVAARIWPVRDKGDVDRRFQVFVSSTFLDLKDERPAIVSALLQMNAFPAGWSSSQRRTRTLGH
jgi:Domain of unknown function (DUF4062)